MHQLTGVAGVGLQQHGLLMAAATDAGAIIEFALAAVAGVVDSSVAGQWLVEGTVVSRYVTLLRAGDGEHQPFMPRQQRLLHSGQDLIGIAVEPGIETRRQRIRDRFVLPVEQIIEADGAPLDVGFELRRDLLRPLAGQIVDALVVIIQTDLRQTLTDRFGLPSIWTAALARCRVCSSLTARSPRMRSTASNRPANWS